MNLNNTELALIEYTKALKIDPRNADAKAQVQLLNHKFISPDDLLDTLKVYDIYEKLKKLNRTSAIRFLDFDSFGHAVAIVLGDLLQKNNCEKDSILTLVQFFGEKGIKLKIIIIQKKSNEIIDDLAKKLNINKEVLSTLGFQISYIKKKTFIGILTFSY